MLKLNLLPPQEKEVLKWDRLNRLLVFHFVWLFVLLGIFVILLVNTLFYLYILVNSQEEMIKIKQSDEKIILLTKKEEEIIRRNKELEQISSKQEEFILWTPILEETSVITPQGIYLENFSYQNMSDQVRISGWANTRSRLVKFDTLLRTNPYFTEVESPLTNLIKQTDINFSFTFEPALD